MQTLWRGPEQTLPSVWALGAALLQPLDGDQYQAEERTRPAAGRAERDSAYAEELALRDFVDTIDRAHVRTKGHSVPPWSAPRCAWRAILIPREDREASQEARHASCGYADFKERRMNSQHN